MDISAVRISNLTENIASLGKGKSNAIPVIDHGGP
jgi:hypothetical protein